MSKRSLLIIILLLAIIDIVAAFWYLAARIEASGDSRDIFTIRKDTAVLATAADTISDINVPDSFMIAERQAYYVSREPAVKGDLSTYFTCVKRVKVRWPKSINGNENVVPLERAVLDKMFTPGTVNLEYAINQELSQPKFTSSHELEYKKIEKRPTPKPAYAYQYDILAYPVMTSMRVLVMGVEKIEYNGIEHKSRNAFIQYDRATHRVITWKDVFASDNNVLLGLINTKIDALNKEKNMLLEHAMAMPTEFQIKAKGISFHFPSGVIAEPNEGPIELFIDYKTLYVVFTPGFKQLVRDNEGFWDYKRLTFDSQSNKK